MKQGLQTVKSWLDALTGLLIGLLVVTLLIGIIWSDQFGTLGNLEAFLSRSKVSLMFLILGSYSERIWPFNSTKFINVFYFLSNLFSIRITISFIL